MITVLGSHKLGGGTEWWCPPWCGEEVFCGFVLLLLVCNIVVLVPPRALPAASYYARCIVLFLFTLWKSVSWSSMELLGVCKLLPGKLQVAGVLLVLCLLLGFGLILLLFTVDLFFLPVLGFLVSASFLLPLPLTICPLSWPWTLQHFF